MSTRQPENIRWAITFGKYHSGDFDLDLGASLGTAAVGQRLVADFSDVMAGMIDFDPSVTTEAVIEALGELEAEGWVQQASLSLWTLSYPPGIRE